ncbi:TPA: hypothetical protein ACGS08_004173 [Pseudomonas aeruginosa]|uniref:hypothetical protein n=1 Tax=Pseudomonas aeruginosa TaxID=287 RepID=UPI0037285BBD
MTKLLVIKLPPAHTRHALLILIYIRRADSGTPADFSTRLPALRSNATWCLPMPRCLLPHTRLTGMLWVIR